MCVAWSSISLSEMVKCCCQYSRQLNTKAILKNEIKFLLDQKWLLVRVCAVVCCLQYDPVLFNVAFQTSQKAFTKSQRSFIFAVSTFIKLFDAILQDHLSRFSALFSSTNVINVLFMLSRRCHRHCVSCHQVEILVIKCAYNYILLDDTFFSPLPMVYAY